MRPRSRAASRRQRSRRCSSSWSRARYSWQASHTVSSSRTTGISSSPYMELSTSGRISWKISARMGSGRHGATGTVTAPPSSGSTSNARRHSASGSRSRGAALATRKSRPLLMRVRRSFLAQASSRLSWGRSVALRTRSRSSPVPSRADTSRASATRRLPASVRARPSLPTQSARVMRRRTVWLRAAASVSSDAGGRETGGWGKARSSPMPPCTKRFCTILSSTCSSYGTRPASRSRWNRSNAPGTVGSTPWWRAVCAQNVATPRSVGSSSAARCRRTSTGCNITGDPRQRPVVPGDADSGA